MWRLSIVITLSVLFHQFLPISVSSKEIWIDANSGNDTSGFGTPTLPFKTVARGVAISFNGDTIRIRPGTYSESVVVPPFRALSFFGSGAAAQCSLKCNTSQAMKILDSCIVRLANLTLSGISDTFGGAISCVNSSLLADSIVVTNSASRYKGGGIYCVGIISLTNSTIRNNTTNGLYGGAQGGALYIDGQLSLLKCSVLANTADGTRLEPGTWAASGGGVYCISGDTVTIDESSFLYNNCYGDGSGGGLLVIAPTVNITRSSFTGNNQSNWGKYAEGARGGGAYISSGGSNITDCRIEGNTASIGGSAVNAIAEGGGIYFSTGTGGLSGCIISGNTASANCGAFGPTYGPAQAYAGGLMFVGGSSAVCSTNVFSQNSALASISEALPGFNHCYAGGGGAVIRSARFAARNTFAKNKAWAFTTAVETWGSSSAKTEGAGVYIGQDVMEFNWNISAFNQDSALCTVPQNDTSIVSISQSGSGIFNNSPNSLCNIFFGNSSSQEFVGNNDLTNRNLDPQFCDLINNDFSIDASSPAAPYANPCGAQSGALPVGCNIVSNIWVDATNGSDIMGTGDSLQPFATIMHAFTVHGDGDTIRLMPGTYREHVRVPWGRIVTIRGSGDASDCIINSDTTRAMTIDSQSEVYLRAMTLTGISDSVGGGIFSRAAILNCDSIAIRNCRAKRYGGGIYNEGMLVVSNSEIADNEARLIGSGESGGGGVYTTGFCTITNSIITRNVVNSYSPMAEGLSNSGGGIYGADAAPMWLSSCEISFNICQSGTGEGGGLKYWGQGGLEVANCRFINNEIRAQSKGSGAASGGGAHIQALSSVTNSVFRGNKITVTGGVGPEPQYVNGGGLLLLSSHGACVGNSFIDNLVEVVRGEQLEGQASGISGNGGGCVVGGNLDFNDNLIANNSVSLTILKSHGGSRWLKIKGAGAEISVATVANNTVALNRAVAKIQDVENMMTYGRDSVEIDGTGIYATDQLYFRSNIVAFNSITQTYDLPINDSSSVSTHIVSSGVTKGSTASGCNVYFGNIGGPQWSGSLDTTDTLANPKFCDTSAGNFELSDNSVATGGSNCALAGSEPVGCVGPCCIGTTGNVDCDVLDAVDIGDLTVLVDHLFISFAPLCCMKEADIFQDKSVDIADLTLLIDHLFITFLPLMSCGD